MTRSIKTQILCAVLSLSAGLISYDADARSGSVGVSVHFDVAPIDLIRTRNAPPSAVRSCTTLKDRVDMIWAGKKRSPTVKCQTNQAMPLIASEQTAGYLVVRP